MYARKSVRGHHLYKTTWSPAIGRVLQVGAEDSNAYDRYAVAIVYAILLLDICLVNYPEGVAFPGARGHFNYANLFLRSAFHSQIRKNLILALITDYTVHCCRIVVAQWLECRQLRSEALGSIPSCIFSLSLFLYYQLLTTRNCLPVWISCVGNSDTHVHTRDFPDITSLKDAPPPALPPPSLQPLPRPSDCPVLLQL